jgi:hypothetical protein
MNMISYRKYSGKEGFYLSRNRCEYRRRRVAECALLPVPSSDKEGREETMMFSDEECEKIYAFLAQAMKVLGLDAVIAEVEQEIEDLESVSSKDIDNLYPHDTASLGRSKAKRQTQKQAVLPGLDVSSVLGQGTPDFDPLTLRERLYTPRRRALLLVNALEFAVIGPVETGERIIRSLKQEKILFGNELHDEYYFTLMASAIDKHLRGAQSLRTHLEKLRQGLKGEGTDGYE